MRKLYPWYQQSIFPVPCRCYTDSRSSLKSGLCLEHWDVAVFNCIYSKRHRLNKHNKRSGFNVKIILGQGFYQIIEVTIVFNRCSSNIYGAQGSQTPNTKLPMILQGTNLLGIEFAKLMAKMVFRVCFTTYVFLNFYLVILQFFKSYHALNPILFISWKPFISVIEKKQVL